MRRRLFGCAGVLFLLSFGTIQAAEEPASPDADYAGAYAKAVDRAIYFLRTKAQATDGSYAAYAGPGATTLVAAAVLRHGRSYLIKRHHKEFTPKINHVHASGSKMLV